MPPVVLPIHRETRVALFRRGEEKQHRPGDKVRLVGPEYEPPPSALPLNVEMLPPCSHEQALVVMQEFDIAVIPFKTNALTNLVGPIRFYQYRALGLPVIPTDFVETALRDREHGTRGNEDIDIEKLVESALHWVDNAEATRDIIEWNHWSAELAAAGMM